MLAQLLRSYGVAIGLGSLALLAGCATNDTTASATSDVRTAMIGQGGSYTIPDQSPAEAAAPYALTGSQEASSLADLAGVHQDYGQSQIVIPPER